MRIAQPTNGTDVDEHFGHCQSFTIFSVDDQKKIVSQETLTPPPGCGCKSSVVPQLASMGVSVMLAGNMGDGAVCVLASNGIQVVPRLLRRCARSRSSVVGRPDRRFRAPAANPTAAVVARDTLEPNAA